MTTTKSYDLTYARPVTTVGHIRKGDLLVVTADEGVYVLPVTEVAHTGKMVTVTAANPENEATRTYRVNYRQSTHRAATKTFNALGGFVYRPQDNPFAD